MSTPISLSFSIIPNSIRTWNGSCPPLPNHSALYHVEFDELQINFDFTDDHRARLSKAKLPILLNLCQCLSKSGGSAGRSENFGRAAGYAGQAIELDATVRAVSLWA